MRVSTMTIADLTTFANKVKDIIADELNDEQLAQCAVVCIEKGMFGRIWDKMWGEDDTEGTYYIRLVRPCSEEAV